LEFDEKAKLQNFTLNFNFRKSTEGKQCSATDPNEDKS